MKPARSRASTSHPATDAKATEAEGIGFTAALYEGHDGTCAVHVPFDPAEHWGPMRHEIVVARKKTKRKVHLVKGTVNGVPFKSAIWFYFRNFVMILAPDVRTKAKVKPGDTLEILVDQVTA